MNLLKIRPELKKNPSLVNAKFKKLNQPRTTTSERISYCVKAIRKKLNQVNKIADLYNDEYWFLRSNFMNRPRHKIIEKYSKDCGINERIIRRIGGWHTTRPNVYTWNKNK